MYDRTRKTDLSSSRRRLVELMQTIGFGEIRDLAIRAGQPQLDPPPEVVREVKLGSRSDARPGAVSGDFALRVQVLELFREFDILGTGTIDAIEVFAGLPSRLRLRGKFTSRIPNQGAGGC